MTILLGRAGHSDNEAGEKEKWKNQRKWPILPPPGDAFNKKAWNGFSDRTQRKCLRKVHEHGNTTVYTSVRDGVTEVVQALVTVIATTT